MNTDNQLLHSAACQWCILTAAQAVLALLQVLHLLTWTTAVWIGWEGLSAKGGHVEMMDRPARKH